MKGADHVLSERVIDRGLAADRRIHLCEQRGRDLNEGHAALIGGGGESRQIPDYPTPQGDECGITRASLLEQRIEDPIKGAPVLVFLAVVNGIGALPERYAESLHASSNRASTCASRGPIPWRPVSITRSETSR